jgi:glycosyltransferase involved in cell wall biosynthesis
MPELYDRFGYFVAPSRVEAQGVAMCEAMACGLPVIATNVGGIPEFVKNEENGLLIPPENPHVLREAVTHLLSSKQLYSTISEQAAKSVKEKLSSDIIYAKEYALLKACTKR